MSKSIGQIVPFFKAKESRDHSHPLWDNVSMARMSETEERLSFVRRVKQAREAAFDTQKPMMTILGVEQGTYKQYETRTPLPHRFIPKFCAATRVSMEWLLTGEGQGPADYPKEVPVRVRRRKAA
jgi:DNA-binding XRE family transcriptional regulator